MSRVTMRRLVSGLGDVSAMMAAASGFLEQVAGFLRQLVHVAGWVVLLVSTVGLVIHPHPDLGHLVVPGAGALAVLQAIIRPWHLHRGRSVPEVGSIPLEPVPTFGSKDDDSAHPGEATAVG